MLTSVMPRERYNFLIDPEQREALRFIKAREGVPESEQIRRAIDDWLKRKGILKSGRKRAALRKRP